MKRKRTLFDFCSHGGKKKTKIMMKANWMQMKHAVPVLQKFQNIEVQDTIHNGVLSFCGMQLCLIMILSQVSCFLK